MSYLKLISGSLLSWQLSFTLVLGLSGVPCAIRCPRIWHLFAHGTPSAPGLLATLRYRSTLQWRQDFYTATLPTASVGIKWRSDWDSAAQQAVRQMFWKTAAAKSKYQSIGLPVDGDRMLTFCNKMCFAKTQIHSIIVFWFMIKKNFLGNFDSNHLKLTDFDLICKWILMYDFWLWFKSKI